jgi:hypothetical protein
MISNSIQEMNIQILSIDYIRKGKSLVSLQAKNETFITEVIEEVTYFEDTDSYLRGINFSNDDFGHILNGGANLGKRFTYEYWQFRDGKLPPPPWDYGEHDEETALWLLNQMRSNKKV